MFVDKYKKFRISQLMDQNTLKLFQQIPVSFTVNSILGLLAHLLMNYQQPSIILLATLAFMMITTFQNMKQKP